MEILSRLTNKENQKEGGADENSSPEEENREKQLLAQKGEQFDIPTREVDGISIPLEVLNYIPEESALHYNVVPLGVEDGVLEVGIVDPDNIEALDALNFISSKAGLPFKVFLISKADFEKVIKMYAGLGGEVQKALKELESDLATDDVVNLEVGEERKEEAVVETELREDAPATKMVATILSYAVEGNASDVHIEHTGSKVRVRFRTDGVLHTSLMLPLKVHSSVTARIKILASLRLDERRKPQDGRFSASIHKKRIDFRVSTFPAYHGEKVVMRILDRSRGAMTLKELGLRDAYIDDVKEIIRQPYGMIIISGPTGSGKSTTLYSMLSLVDREGKNTVSLEDPVEYSIDGVSQSQVRPEIGYSFANGLRSVLRQDPDIIMVGEIRDKETAQLAVQAALTGHVVFTTLHTNNAVGAIPRLIDMGVDPYLIAPTLKMVIGQRLVRRLCPGTGRPIPLQGSLKAMLDKQFEDLPAEFREKISIGKEVYGIEPADGCPTGTQGRIGVFEILTMSKRLENVILRDPVEEEISKIARQEGMLYMKEDAIIKAFEKAVPFEEVNTLGGDIYVE